MRGETLQKTDERAMWTKTAHLKDHYRVEAPFDSSRVEHIRHEHGTPDDVEIADELPDHAHKNDCIQPVKCCIVV